MCDVEVFGFLSIFCETKKCDQANALSLRIPNLLKEKICDRREIRESPVFSLRS